MPTPDLTQPSLIGPKESSNIGLRRFLHVALGLIAIGALALTVWPGLISTFAPGVDLDQFGGVTPFRFLTFFAFAVAMTLRFRVNPGGQRSRKSVAWEQFATQVGGVFTNERRKPTASGWEGGPTVRWVSRGVTIALSSSTDTSSNCHTQFRSAVRLSRAFQFHVTEETLLTKAFLSPQLWSVVLAGVKSGEAQGETSEEQALLARRMAFMAEKEILIGDSLFDAAFLLKSDNAGQAREFFSDSSVSSRLHELKARHKGWYLRLVVADQPDGHELALAMPGTVREPEDLEASRQVMEAAIGCLTDRGMLAASGSRAA